MTTINLYQDQQEAQRKLSSRAGNGGLLFSLGILVLTLVALGGLKIAVSMLEQNSTALAESVQKENKNLAGFGDLERIVDMQTRLQVIKNNLQVKDNAVTRPQMTQVLDHLGSDLGSGVVVTSYKYENGKVSVVFNANNFNDASRQILNFKKSDYFTGVNLVDIAREESGIKCNVEMNIKN